MPRGYFGAHVKGTKNRLTVYANSLSLKKKYPIIGFGRVVRQTVLKRRGFINYTRLGLRKTLFVASNVKSDSMF